MATGLMKALMRTVSSDSQLNVAIYQEKCIQGAQQKLLDAHREASSAWAQYNECESNPEIHHLLSQVGNIHTLWIRAHEDFVQQYSSYRNCYLEVLKGERTVSEMQKVVDDYTPKINKLRKQLDSVTAKGKDKKQEALTMDVGKYLSLQQKAGKELQIQKENHKLFKLRTIRNAVKLVTDAEITLHERCHAMFQTQRLIHDYFTASTYTTGNLKQAKTNSEALIADLKRQLKLDGPGEPACCNLPSSQPVLNEVASENSADVSGGLEMDPEEQAMYTPIPDLEPQLQIPPRRTPSKGKDNTPERPLPAVPPTDRHFRAAPPIPMRKDLPGTQTTPRQASEEEQAQYLDMEASESWKTNSVYDNSEPERASYHLLSQAKSGSMNSSIKSQGSTGSRNSSGLESRGSTGSWQGNRQGSTGSGRDSGVGSKGSTKSTESGEQENVYEVLDSRFRRNPRNIDEDVYEM